MSHYCCKSCGLRYDDCRCGGNGPYARDSTKPASGFIEQIEHAKQRVASMPPWMRNNMRFATATLPNTAPPEVTDAMVEAALLDFYGHSVDYLFRPDQASGLRAKMRAAIVAALGAR